MFILLSAMMKPIKILLIIITISVSFAFIHFANEVTGSTAPPCGGADAVVAITGGKGRSEEALRLLRAGKARLLILSGVDASADLKEIFFLETLKRRSLPSSIIVEKHSRNTYENALETKRIAEDLGLESIILVTSLYHMKRALYTFKRVMPWLRICQHPVESPNFHRQWWKDWKSLRLLLTEFLKFYWYRLYLLPMHQGLRSRMTHQG